MQTQNSLWLISLQFLTPCDINVWILLRVRFSVKFSKIKIKNTYSLYLSETKLVALTTTSSGVLTVTGTFLHPGDFRILMSKRKLSCNFFGGHMSIFVTTTNTGTDNAKARPRCSFVIPTIPAFAPTISIPEKFYFYSFPHKT